MVSSYVRLSSNFGGFDLGVTLNEIDDDYVYIMWSIDQLDD